MRSAPVGLLLVDKPAGPTSHDVVDRVRRALGVKRVGHTGTLDPFATGLLALLVGAATRLSEYFSGLDKAYEAVVRLGSSTDTDDRTGEVRAVSADWRSLTEADIVAAASALTGEIDQVPPAYSAKKRGGERSYARARRGEPVVLEPVRVNVYDFRVVGVELPDVQLSIRCSSGTYVRSLGRDLGHRLGVGGHVRELRRTGVGVLDVRDAVAIEDVTAADLAASVRDPVVGLPHMPRFEIDEQGERRLLSGQRLATEGQVGGVEGPVLALRGGRLVSVGRVEADTFHPKKVFPVEAVL